MCVTGASGFVGTHVVAAFLERGHRVRGTVRDTGDDAKCAHLRELSGANERLELVDADLLEPGSFDSAVEGCGAVVHTAAVAKLTSKDPQRDIVDPSVHGVENVISAVRIASCARVFVQTSSMAAVTNAPDPTREYSEADWNDTATLERDPYGLAKAQAERAVWEFAEEPGAPRCVAINPTLVLGPVWTKAHANTSPSVIRDVVRGSYPANPKFHFGLVDGRDVGLAHALAVEKDVTGRHILVADALWMKEIAEVLREAYPKRSISHRELPNFIMFFASLFDKRIDRASLRALLDKEIRLDNTRSRENLGLAYRPVKQSLIDTAQSLIEHGFA